MYTKFSVLLGTDRLVTATAIGLLSTSLAPSTYANCDDALRHFFTFRAIEGLAPLHATHATMVHYNAWLGILGAMAASSMQLYFSAMNEYFRDHQLFYIAAGELIADARRGLEMQQQRLVPFKKQTTATNPYCHEHFVCRCRNP
jgi:hypothetical protein